MHPASIEYTYEAMHIAASFITDRDASEEPQAADGISRLGSPVSTVAYNGTWQKRAQPSLNRVGAVIRVDSGLVLDFQVVSMIVDRPKVKFTYMPGNGSGSVRKMLMVHPILWKLRQPSTTLRGQSDRGSLFTA